MTMKNFGRHRQSLADIEQELHNVFREHPQCYTNPQGVASLPARCLPDVFDTYQEEYGVELLTKDEMTSFTQIVDASPGVEATPDTILQLVAMRTSPGQQSASEEDSPNADDWDRGRADERAFHGQQSRSSSTGSTGTYCHTTPSRPPSRGVVGMPRTPGTKDSPFDAQKRQRSTPLAPAAPSSWTRRPVAPGRRKSDSSSHSRAMSDSEVSTIPRSARGTCIYTFVRVARCHSSSLPHGAMKFSFGGLLQLPRTLVCGSGTLPYVTVLQAYLVRTKTCSLIAGQKSHMLLCF